MSDFNTPWRTLEQIAARIGPNRSKRFAAREIRAGRLKAARIGGRGEYVSRDEWIDEYVESQVRPVIVATRRRA